MVILTMKREVSEFCRFLQSSFPSVIPERLFQIYGRFFQKKHKVVSDEKIVLEIRIFLERDSDGGSEG